MFIALSQSRTEKISKTRRKHRAYHSTETAGKWEDRLARRRGKTEPGEQETAEEWEARHNG